MSIYERSTLPNPLPDPATPEQTQELVSVMWRFIGSPDPGVESSRILSSFPGGYLPVYLSRHFERAVGHFDYTLRVACAGVYGAVLLSRGNETIGDQHLRFGIVSPTEDNPAGITRGTAWVPPVNTAAAPTLTEICEPTESTSGAADLPIPSPRLPAATMSEVSALIGIVRRHVE